MRMNSVDRAAWRRSLAWVAAALTVALLSPGQAPAAPTPDGLSGLIRMPTAFVRMGTATYRRGSEFGASFAYPVMPSLEAGLTRERGEFGIHAKAQVFGSSESLLPAVALGVRDLHESFGKRSWFWAFSKATPGGELAVHGGVRRGDGPFSGATDWFGGVEVPMTPTFKAKAEYDWGGKSGSAGIEVRIGGNLVAYDYILDAFGSGPASSNMIGISFQDQF